MSGCSFHGMLSGQDLAWLFALLFAALLAPVGIGAVVGWRFGRRKGRPWWGTLKGALWVIGSYLALLALWWGAQIVEQRQNHARWQAEEAALAPVRGVRAGGWTELLARTDLERLAPALRRAWIDLAVRRAGMPLAWTDADLAALDSFAQELAHRPQEGVAGPRLAAMVAFHREGEAGWRRVREQCDGAGACERAIDDALASNDQARVSEASRLDLLWQAQPLDAAARAALERMLRRQREAAGQWGSLADARLAFDRIARGQLAHALEACGSELPPAPQLRPDFELQRCWLQLLPALEAHGPARLCPQGGGLHADDRRAIAAWRGAWQSHHAARFAQWSKALEARCAVDQPG